MTFSLPYLGLLRQKCHEWSPGKHFSVSAIDSSVDSPHGSPGISANHCRCPIVKARCPDPSDLLTSWEWERGFINRGEQMPSSLLGSQGCGTAGSEMSVQVWPRVSNCSCKARLHVPLSPEAMCTEAGDSAYF